MTVSTATSRIEYTGDAVTTAFSFPYYFLANGDLKVYLDGVLQTITTHYTVAGAGVGAGGTVTFVTAPPNGDVVVIYREVAITQSVDYTPNDPFPANTHEQALDRLTMIAQQLDEESGRVLALPSTSTYSDLTLPDPQANYYLQWKADLSGVQNVAAVSPGALSVTPYIETLLNDPDAATARITLGNVATLAGSTLTTATLTSPVLNSPVLNSPVLNGTLSGTAFLDEATLVSNSAIAAPSQQSVKAYVDAATAAPKFNSYLTVNKSMTNTNLYWNTTNYTFAEDAGLSGFDAASGQFTPNRAGHYLIGYHFQTESVDVGSNLIFHIYKNGTFHVYLSTPPHPGPGSTFHYGASALVYMNGTTDYLTFLIGSADVSWSLSGNTTGERTRVFGFKVP